MYDFPLLNSQRIELSKLVKKLGGRTLKLKASHTTCTHLVTDRESKTVNVYFAVSRGLWIVSSKWVGEIPVAK